MNLRGRGERRRAERVRDGMWPLSKALIYNSELAAGVAGRFSQGTAEGYSARSLGLIRCSRKEGKSETRSNGASENGSNGTKRRGRNSISQKANQELVEDTICTRDIYISAFTTCFMKIVVLQHSRFGPCSDTQAWTMTAESVKHLGRRGEDGRSSLEIDLSTSKWAIRNHDLSSKRALQERLSGNSILPRHSSSIRLL